MVGTFDIAPMRSPLPTSPWFMCPKADAAAPLRLWCLTFAGGGAAIWHPWGAQLDGVAEIAVLRPPGRESRLSEPLFRRVPDIVSALADQIAPFTHEEYALCGHSLGGLLAFELARTLRARQLGHPRALIVCAVRAPQHPPPTPLLHALPAREFIEQVERRFGPIPREIREYPEALDLLLPVLRADLEAYETYQYAQGPALDIPLLALGGESDPNVSASQLHDWHGHTLGRFELEMMPGGHFFPQEDLRAATDRVRRFLETLNRTKRTRVPPRPLRTL